MAELIDDEIQKDVEWEMLSPNLGVMSNSTEFYITLGFDGQPVKSCIIQPNTTNTTIQLLYVGIDRNGNLGGYVIVAPFQAQLLRTAIESHNIEVNILNYEGHDNRFKCGMTVNWQQLRKIKHFIEVINELTPVSEFVRETLDDCYRYVLYATTIKDFRYHPDQPIIYLPDTTNPIELRYRQQALEFSPLCEREGDYFHNVDGKRVYQKKCSVPKYPWAAYMLVTRTQRTGTVFEFQHTKPLPVPVKMEHRYETCWHEYPAEDASGIPLLHKALVAGNIYTPEYYYRIKHLLEENPTRVLHHCRYGWNPLQIIESIRIIEVKALLLEAFSKVEHLASPYQIAQYKFHEMHTPKYVHDFLIKHELLLSLVRKQKYNSDALNRARLLLRMRCDRELDSERERSSVFNEKLELWFSGMPSDQEFKEQVYTGFKQLYQRAIPPKAKLHQWSEAGDCQAISIYLGTITKKLSQTIPVNYLSHYFSQWLNRLIDREGITLEQQFLKVHDGEQCITSFKGLAQRLAKQIQTYIETQFEAHQSNVIAMLNKANAGYCGTYLLECKSIQFSRSLNPVRARQIHALCAELKESFKCKDSTSFLLALKDWQQRFIRKLTLLRQSELLDFIKLYTLCAINLQDTRGYTPLLIAINLDHYQLAEYLLQLGISPSNIKHILPRVKNGELDFGDCIDYLPVDNAKSADMLALLLRHGVSIHQLKARYFEAIRDGDVGMVKMLLSYEMTPLTSDGQSGITALQWLALCRIKTTEPELIANMDEIARLLFEALYWRKQMIAEGDYDMDFPFANILNSNGRHCRVSRQPHRHILDLIYNHRQQNLAMTVNIDGDKYVAETKACVLLTPAERDQVKALFKPWFRVISDNSETGIDNYLAKIFPKNETLSSSQVGSSKVQLIKRSSQVVGFSAYAILKAYHPSIGEFYIFDAKLSATHMKFTRKGFIDFIKQHYLSVLSQFKGKTVFLFSKLVHPYLALYGFDPDTDFSPASYLPRDLYEAIVQATGEVLNADGTITRLLEVLVKPNPRSMPFIKASMLTGHNADKALPFVMQATPQNIALLCARMRIVADPRLIEANRRGLAMLEYPDEPASTSTTAEVPAPPSEFPLLRALRRDSQLRIEAAPCDAQPAAVNRAINKR